MLRFLSCKSFGSACQFYFSREDGYADRDRHGRDQRAYSEILRYQNVSFSFSDAKNTPFPDNTFDAVTVAYGIRNIPDTDVALREFSRVLKPGGKFICLELTRPRPAWFRVPYEWYVFKVMPKIAMMVTKNAKPYLYLPRSINAFYSPDEFKQLIASCGFTDVTADSLTMGIATITKAVKT